MGPEQQHDHEAADDRRYSERKIDDAVQQPPGPLAQPAPANEQQGEQDAEYRVEYCHDDDNGSGHGHRMQRLRPGEGGSEGGEAAAKRFGSDLGQWSQQQEHKDGIRHPD